VIALAAAKFPGPPACGHRRARRARWAPIGQIRRTVGEVAEVLGDVFPELVES
jgi:hypothetical protein